MSSNETPAFPQSIGPDGPFDNMALRDRFAWEVFQAELPSILKAASFRRAVEGMAARSYIVADAMIAQRDKEAQP